MSNRWLEQVKEEIIDPERPIIDPHHHLWRDKKAADYELENLWTDTASGHNIIGTVFVECARGALEEQELHKTITKTTTYAYGGPDGFRTQCLLLSDFLLIIYVYAMYLLDFK